MLKRRNKKTKYAIGGLAAPADNILAEGGMLDNSGEMMNGTEVPVGSLREEVADDVPAMLSEGEFVVPADVVRFVGLERLMKMRDKAKEGLERMEEMGQMGNADEVGNPDQQFAQVDDIAFENDIDSIMGEVDRDSAAMQTQQMFAAGGFVTGTDLSKAVQNPAVDVRYYKHDDGRVMYITHINDKPMTAVPDGFKEVSPEEARQVGKKAEESAAATGGGATGGTGGDGGGGGGDSDGGPVGTGPMGPTGWADLSLSAAKVAETLAKSPVPSHKAAAKAIDFGSMQAADISFAQTQAGFDAMQAAASVPGIMSVSGNQGQITTVSTPQSIAAADAAMFAPTPMESLNEAIAASPQATEAANTGMATNAAGQTVSNTATVAAQDAATFGGVSTGIGVGDVSEAAATGMTSVDGVSVSNDATVAAQDAANFGADAVSGGGGDDGGVGVGDSGPSGSSGAGGASAAGPGEDDGGAGGGGGGGGGGGDGTIICTKLYELGLMDEAVYEADQAYGKLVAVKDPALMDGYHYWANIVVDWMSGSGIRVIPFVSDAQHGTIMSTWATSWTHEIATPWAEHMQYLMGGRKEDSKIGKALMSVGVPISKMFAKKKTPPSKLLAIGCIATFATLYVAVKIAKLFTK
jgi:hypothetical protein